MKLMPGFIFIFFLVSSVPGLYGQQPGLPDVKNDSIPGREKIHIHTDREVYSDGETIWFKAYLLKGHLPDLTLTTLFVDLVNQGGSLLKHLVLPAFDGICAASVTINNAAASEFVFMKAYTDQLYQNDTDQVYLKRLGLFTKNKSRENRVTDTVKVKPVVRLFPESGSLVNDVVNKVAFKANLYNGDPFSITGLIKNEKGEIIDSAKTVHDGMGLFSITPQENDQYFFEWKDDNGEMQRTDLPKSTNNHITLHAEQLNNLLYYIIQNPSPGATLEKIKIIATLHDKIVYMANVDMKDNPVFSGRLSLNKLPPGIMQVTAYNSSDEPIAERLVFINKQRLQFEGSVKMQETDLSKRGKNILEIQVKDTLPANFSLAIYEEAFNNEENSNILSDLLINSEIKGVVHDPNWYFGSDNPDRTKGLDLVMMTNGWRKYKQESSDYRLAKNENYITLSGVVTDGKDLPVKGQPFTIMVNTNKDSTREIYNVTTDSAGRFTANNLLFYDTAIVRYWFNQANKQNNSWHLIMNKPFSNPNNKFVPLNKSFLRPSASIQNNEAVTDWGSKGYLDGFTAKGFKLADVTVNSKNWRKDPMLIMDEKYTTGLFKASSDAFKFDVMSDPIKSAKMDILNYILGKVPGLSLEYPKGRSTGGAKKLLYRRAPIELIFIDERPVRFDPSDPQAYSEIQNLDIESIAYLKFFPRYPLEPDKPALAIYLKKGDEIDQNKISSLPKIPIQGYSIVKEFYSPDYSELAQKNNVNPDFRATLYWQPQILFDKDKQKATITFYNNDVSQKLRLVLEGISEGGNLYYTSQVIQNNK